MGIESIPNSLHNPSHQIHPSESHAQYNETPGSYVGSTHWSAILEDIHDLKSILTGTQDTLNDNTIIQSECSPRWDETIFGVSSNYTLDQIVSQYLPPRIEVDRCLSTYFQGETYIVPFIHTYQFQRQYREFWVNTTGANPLWLSILFSICHLSTLIGRSTSIGSPYAPRNESTNGNIEFHAAAGQCLVLGKYHQAREFSVQALALYGQCKNLQALDPSRDVGTILSLIVRMSYEMGFHRDPDTGGKFTVFEGEMRRRFWASVKQMDLMTSFQLGLPSNINLEHSDTKSPRHLLDSDFDEDIAILPTPKSENEGSKLLWFIVKERQFVSFSKVCRDALSFQDKSETEVMALDTEVREMYASVPKSLQSRPISESIPDQPFMIMTRIYIDFIHLKSLCILHRKYVARGSAFSILACVEAGSKLVGQFIDMNGEFVPGGQLYNVRWMLTNFTVNDFLLGIMVLCLALHTRWKPSSQMSPISLSTESDVLTLLEKAYTVCMEMSPASKDARKVSQIIKLTLERAKIESSNGPSNEMSVHAVASSVSTDLVDASVGNVGLASPAFSMMPPWQSYDGRVDIRIDETNTRLTEQIDQLHQAAHQQQDSQKRRSSEPSPEYRVADNEAPPRLNIVIHVVGSRGDVQPFVALGRVLKATYGHRVRLATHGTFKKFVEENGLEFFEIGGDPAELMAFMVKNPGLIPGVKSLKAGDVGKRRKGMAEIMQGCWRSCADASEVKKYENEGSGAVNVRPFIANAIIANPPSFAHIHCAEKLGIPLHLMFTMPWSPTQDFPHPIANIKSSNAGGSMTNEMSYTLVDMMTWQGLGDIINKFRKETLDLGIITQASAVSMLHRLRIPYTYCWSPALIPKPKDWGSHIDISGFYFLSLASNYQPDANLAAFLDAGPPPVYIGFGSIVVDDPNAMTELIFEAVRKTGHRALVSKGWGGLGGDELSKPEGVFMLGNCPHDWLFQRVSCVVHHGGAGTTAAGIALGCPTVIVPFFGDQPFWGAMVARAGAGPSPIPFKDLTVESLTAGILEALKPETLERAKILGDRIREEKGSEAGAASFHAQMDVPKLRCIMAPSRVAVWQVITKGSSTENIRLSAFAASVLGDEGLIDVNQLKLYRPVEYAVEEISVIANFSGANPITGTLGSIASGLLHYPVDLAKAYGGVVYEPYKGARADGLRGFGKGIGKGLGGLIFRRRGLVIGGKKYGMSAVYESIRKRLGSDTLSFIFAAHFTQGFEEARAATEDERREVIRKWEELKPNLKKEMTETSTSSSTSTNEQTSTAGRSGL
ncbi:hypothetical protein VTL71DRAFT_6574 [Oculimacula yallundae]|uniref:Xylanolytic transcriptional activator regulatory domain-containing protein n=1 Tax=Oculimacula yallundae TaxID=86028 RepID=A0ABR4BXD0_9HELO